MTTPICDFVTEYCLSRKVRLHMPGHKGAALHGLEPFDITEIAGAGYLYDNEGIISESESNAALLFGSGRTLYSTEGSSLSIKTMLAIAATALKEEGKRPLILASRNAHKAFLDAACLLDLDVSFIMQSAPSPSLCQCFITPKDVKAAIESLETKPTAVFVTSPDYMGSILDIKGIKEVCREYSLPLLVDNAHGAYLKFLQKSLHPLDMGADMCCDSAHKTLPVYTGGGYLHINANADKRFFDDPKGLMSIFASTSPSYIIMQSLDFCNKVLSNEFPTLLENALPKADKAKQEIADMGYALIGKEPMKITIMPQSYGYTGNELADHLRENDIEPEYSDPYAVVLMVSPYNSDEDYERLLFALSLLPRKKAIEGMPIMLPKPIQRVSIRKAMLSKPRRINVDEAEGLICARTAVSCQPSIPIAVAGEEITGEIIKILKRYGIFEIGVL
ncbi:MAG: PLP-dependent transferase [Ruminococcus sp.]|nr:PLP-dependent transferase [Ruminococcus sp.]